MKNLKPSCIFFIQKCVLSCSFFVSRLLTKSTEKKGVVVGIEEIASLLHQMGGALNEAKTVCVSDHRFYTAVYDYPLHKWFKKSILIHRLRFFILPALLGYLASKHRTFIYISGSGYLLRQFDGREFEFKWLRERGCHVICYFTGSDIRSFKMEKELSIALDRDLVTTYQQIVTPYLASSKGEDIRHMLAQSAEKYASAIFKTKVDQIAPISRECYPFKYFTPDSEVHFYPEKFVENKRIKIVHAPSSPFIKGTPIVRAAIKKLKEEGFLFEYVELINTPNLVVKETLKSAHIVLNQFYGLGIGQFGIEAMMNNAVMMCSADSTIETSLEAGASKAWVVTPYWQVYDILKKHLLMPISELKYIADSGTSWVKMHHTYSVSAAYVEKVIEQLDE